MTNFFHQKFIGYALNLARKNLGKTAPNPCVACVIVKNGEIISTAVTAIGGRPHAEKIAINQIQNKSILSDCEIYVTLEPCSHQGESGSCVDEIIKHKIKKVVIATIDQNILVNGNGIKKLAEAGIEVFCGVLENEAKEINKAFFKAILKKIPYLTLKMAVTLDGKIATKNFQSKWITNQKSRQFSHYLRSINDAIMIGGNTLRYDDPMLDCRIDGLENFSPKRIIISRKLDFNFDKKIFNTADKIPTFIVTSNQNKKIKELVDKKVEFIFCEEKENKINLNEAFNKICSLGINSVLVEGGSNLATQLFQQNLIDEMVLIRSNKIFGNDAIGFVQNLNLNSIDEEIFLREKTHQFDDNLVEIFKAKSNIVCSSK
jgi:diaminohydroxyphosphoribosylaminopyrimidine deaminase/5-amino-6-(5-phosphoribosylamino)uracil reductase